MTLFKETRKFSEHALKLVGRFKIPVKLDFFLQERPASRPAAASCAVQTDKFSLKQQRVLLPALTKRKTGIEKQCQVHCPDLFDFDREVQPVVALIASKTLEQAHLEIFREEELLQLSLKKEQLLKARELRLVSAPDEAVARAAATRSQQQQLESEAAQRLQVLANFKEKLRLRMVAADFVRGLRVSLPVEDLEAVEEAVQLRDWLLQSAQRKVAMRASSNWAFASFVQTSSLFAIELRQLVHPPPPPPPVRTSPPPPVCVVTPAERLSSFFAAFADALLLGEEEGAAPPDPVWRAAPLSLAGLSTLAFTFANNPALPLLRSSRPFQPLFLAFDAQGRRLEAPGWLRVSERKFSYAQATNAEVVAEVDLRLGSDALVVAAVCEDVQALSALSAGTVDLTLAALLDDCPFRPFALRPEQGPPLDAGRKLLVLHSLTRGGEGRFVQESLHRCLPFEGELSAVVERIGQCLARDAGLYRLDTMGRRWPDAPDETAEGAEDLARLIYARGKELGPTLLEALGQDSDAEVDLRISPGGPLLAAEPDRFVAELTARARSCLSAYEIVAERIPPPEQPAEAED